MTNTYIQDKLDELIKTYRKTTVIYEKQNGDEVKEKVNSYFTEYDARMIAERLVADYHNYIVEKIKEQETVSITPETRLAEIESYKLGAKSMKQQILLSLLQDTNPKE